jgi:DNA recombination protein RmuC
MSATDPEEKAIHLKAHIEALRAQVDGLSKKDYSKYLDTGYTKLDFVIMYVFHEGALNLALMNDSSLWRYAYDRHVLIMGPQTMYMNLRVLELMWTQSRQLTNQDEIMKQAKMIIERVKLFARRLTETESSMQEVMGKFKELRTVTAEKGKSIITPANELIRLSGIALKSNGKGGVSPTYIEGDETSFFGDEKKKKKNSTITDEDATVVEEIDEDESEDIETMEADASEASEQNE